MARAQQFNNGQREVINTIEDTSKYQTGMGRRQRVAADPLFIPVAAESSSINKFAEALGKVKPELMSWAVNKQADEYTAQINAGTIKAHSGAIPEGEMEQYGYDKVKSVNDWTDWQLKMTQEYEQNFDKENGNVEEFLKQQWESHPFTDKSETYKANFTALAGKTMGKVRELQGAFKADLQETRNNTELVRMFAHDINDVMASGQDYTTRDYQARRFNLKETFPGKTNTQLDEIAFNAVLQSAQDTGDTSLFDIFKEPHIDGTPGLYEIPKWKTMVDNQVKAIEASNKAARTEQRTVEEKALKDAAETTQRGILFELIDINNFEDPTVRSAKLTDLIAKAQQLSEQGIPLSDSTINLLRTTASGVDKKEETAYQAQNYNTLRLGNPSTSQIAIAVKRGDISQSGFEKLMNAKDAAANREATRSSKGEKPIAASPFIKEMSKTIKAAAGYNPYNLSKDSEEARQNALAVEARVLEHVEGLIDSGTDVRSAAAEGSKMGLTLLKEAGMYSEERKTASSKLDAVAQKKANPVSYYKANPLEFQSDYSQGFVPKGILEKDLRGLQVEAEKAIKAKKKLKQTEKVTK